MKDVLSHIHLLILLVLLCIACQTESEEESYVVGVSQCTLEGTWRQSMLLDMQVKASEYPNLSLLVENAADSSALQVEQIRSLIERKVDLLIVSANEAEPVTQKKPASSQSAAQEVPAGEKANADEDSEPNLFAALTSNGEPAAKPAKTTQDAPKQVSLFDKPPIFSYGGAKEEIKDASITFEELRIAKSDDFPELAEGKKVSWTVTYGKVTKYISDPKGTAIAGVKEEIEKSKSFLDALKKAAKEKDRSPDCLVTPKVTAQSKGIASYKGVFATVEDAQASDKSICLIPSRDGRIYELRKTEMGDFIAPKHKIVDFSAVRAGFTPALPLIPRELIGQIISFFRCFMNEYEEFEALAHIYWDKEQEEYTVFIPRQRVSKARVDADLRGSALPEERFIHYADIHSHNSMAAKFSYTDDADERATRLYFVVGHLDRFYPTITARMSCGGTYQEIDPSLVLEGVGADFPTEWLDQVERCGAKEPPAKGCQRSHWSDLLFGLPEVVLG